MLRKVVTVDNLKTLGRGHLPEHLSIETRLTGEHSAMHIWGGGAALQVV